MFNFNERVNCCGNSFNHPRLDATGSEPPSRAKRGLNVARRYSQHFVGQLFLPTPLAAQHNFGCLFQLTILAETKIDAACFVFHRFSFG